MRMPERIAWIVILPVFITGIIALGYGLYRIVRWLVSLIP